jgi:leucyl-tRNA---protein transferase
MTRDISPDIKTIQLYLTEPHPCSYLDDRNAITAFVDPKINPRGAVYDYLSELGFRRSGQYIYTPRCATCKACVPVRVPVRDFRANRKQRRCLNRNTDLELLIKTSVDVEEHYLIYEKYINTRHTDGDMYPASLNQFQSFIGTNWDCTRYLEFRLRGRLVCCALIDWLSSGLSAIYTYFDPELATRSLGTYAILKQIELTRTRGLDYVYLGYWIKDSEKMNYKTQFRPIELFVENRWLTLD